MLRTNRLYEPLRTFRDLRQLQQIPLTRENTDMVGNVCQWVLKEHRLTGISKFIIRISILLPLYLEQI